MYKRKKSYIKEIVDAIVSIEFPDWEECSPLIRKTGDKTKHKVLLAQLLEAIMLENKYLHNSGIPFHYSFDKQDVLDVIFRDRKNEIDPNDPLKRKYRETDPRNEEGTERLFEIIYTANKKKKITNTYILKHQYRPYFVIGKSINSITYYNDNGTRQEVPKYALPEKIRKEIGSDISTKIYVNLGAIAVAKIEIDRIEVVWQKLNENNQKQSKALLLDKLATLSNSNDSRRPLIIVSSTLSLTALAISL
jgi:hypothetical protein